MEMRENAFMFPKNIDVKIDSKYLSKIVHCAMPMKEEDHEVITCL